MLFFPAFCALTWYFCFRYRRRWPGLVIALTALVLVFTIALVDRKLHEWTGSQAPKWSNIQFLLFIEAGALVGPGLFLWGMPRVTARYPCRRCGYDLYGLDDSNPTCPECGLDLAAYKHLLAPHRRLRSRFIMGPVAPASLDEQAQFKDDTANTQPIIDATATTHTPPRSAE